MNYVAERFAQAAFTVFAVITLSFGLIRLMPGGPMDYIRAQLLQNNPDITQAELDRLVATYASVQPNEPVWRQYVDYMLAVVQGDFGTSMYYSLPVNEIVADALPWTVFLMSTGLLLTFTLGIALGALMAYNEGSRFDTVTTSIAVFLNSIPYYLAAILLLFLLAYHYPVFPTGGRMNPDTVAGFNYPFVAGVLKHAALPVFSLVITGFGIQAFRMRANSISVLGSDYIRVARLRSLPQRRIAGRYVARNAMLPLYTDLMIAFGLVFGGSVILEEIYNYSGLGYYVLKAVYARDYPLMMSGFIIITIAVVLGVLVADLTYSWIDPRVGGGDDETY